MFHMAVELRPINNAIIKYDRPMPNMGTVNLDLEKAQLVAQLEMAHAYFQVIIHPE